MNCSMKTVFLCLVAMAADLTMAQTSPTQPLQTNYLPDKILILGQPIPCPVTGDCLVPVTVVLPTGSGCQVTLSSEIDLAKDRLLTRIVWTLSPSSFTAYPGTAYSFQPDYGILVVKDGGRQMARAGVGKTNFPNDTYTVYHVRNPINDDVTYLPVVLQTVTPTDGSSPVITLCGARDPKIVNG